MICRIVSNGYGEDLIGTHVAKALMQTCPQLTIQVYPLVGDGVVYQKMGLTPVCQGLSLPSGGFIRSVRDLMGDLRAGLFSQSFGLYRRLRQERKGVDFTICIGDIFCLWMGRASHPTFFLSTAKSDTFMPHSGLECWLMRRWVQQVFPRDLLTHESLVTAGVPSSFFGNLMLEGLAPTGQDYGVSEYEHVIGVLPGSRDEAYDNLGRVLSLLDLDSRYGVMVSVAPQLERKRVEAVLDVAGYVHDSGGMFTHQESGGRLLLCTSFPDVLYHATRMIGLAGTANEQAVYYGHHVLCFPGKGPQTSLQRFQEQAQLLGPSLHLLEDTTSESLIETLMGMPGPEKQVPDSSAAMGMADCFFSFMSLGL